MSATYHRLWAEHFLHPQFDAVGERLVVFGPQNVEVTGNDVRLGNHVHMMAKPDAPIRFTSYAEPGGHIEVGDYTIILPGVRIASALSIKIGRNCMFAGHSYVSDADWHDIYDRSKPIGKTAPVILEENVWIGDSAIVCKGVRIGENTVIGAGSVVAGDIPANVIAAGNPARVIRELDPDMTLTRRQDLLANGHALDRQIDALDRYLLANNSWLRWLRSLVNPRQGD